MRETVEFLKENKIDYFGSPLDDKNAYIEKEINGLKIALVCYNRFLKLLKTMFKLDNNFLIFYKFRLQMKNML